MNWPSFSDFLSFKSIQNQFVKTRKTILSQYQFLDIFARKNFVRMDFISLLNVRIGNVEPFWQTFQVYIFVINIQWKIIHSQKSYIKYSVFHFQRFLGRKTAPHLLILSSSINCSSWWRTLDLIWWRLSTSWKGTYAEENISSGREISRIIENCHHSCQLETNLSSIGSLLKLETQ